MAEESEQAKKNKMNDETSNLLNDLNSLMRDFMETICRVAGKRSCNRAEASLIKAHGVILKAKLTELHNAKIAD